MSIVEPAARERASHAQAPTRRPVQDLRDWLARVQAIGELVTVTAPVERDEEMSAISYLVAKQVPSPAVLFESARGFGASPLGARLLWNILGPSFRRVALTLEEPVDTPVGDLIVRAKDKLKRRIPPREVAREEAPVYEHTLLGEAIDLDLLPIPRHWPLDGGRYAGTADAVITRDPDSGYLNIGTYRMMLQGKNEVGLYLSPGKDARLHITRAWQQGKALEVAAAWGIDPLFMLVGSQTFAKNVSEYEFAGGIKGEAIPVVRGTTTDLLLPANAELVIEGIIRPNAVRMEGPFGEFPGYYGRPEAGCPLVEVTAVHYRGRPILTNALMADYPSCEQSGFFSVMRSAKIWDDLDRLGIPGIKGVYSHPAAA
jgi:UbiD family decarboxylase